MAELTREDLYQIKMALMGAKEQIEKLMGANVGTANAEIIDAYRLIDAALYPMPAVPAAKAKTVKLSAAQREMAHKIDYNGTLRVVFGTQAYRTMDAMRKKGLVEITEIDHPWGSYYGLTEAGYAALSNR